MLESLTHLGDGESFPSRSRFRRVKTHIDIPRSGILFAHPNSTLSLLITSFIRGKRREGFRVVVRSSRGETRAPLDGIAAILLSLPPPQHRRLSSPVPGVGIPCAAASRAAARNAPARVAGLWLAGRGADLRRSGRGLDRLPNTGRDRPQRQGGLRGRLWRRRMRPSGPACLPLLLL